MFTLHCFSSRSSPPISDTVALNCSPGFATRITVIQKLFPNNRRVERWIPLSVPVPSAPFAYLFKGDGIGIAKPIHHNLLACNGLAHRILT